MKKADAKPPERMSDAAVQAKTGKTWPEWFAVLDTAGAAKMTHKQIAAHLHERLGVPGWWCQMVAVGYEQERGLREKHETPAGYQISRSKTLAVPVDRLYSAWHDKKTRGRWLRDPSFTVRKATENKSLRITWIDGVTSLEVMFYAKGKDKSQVSVQHSKLPDAAAAERSKKYWTGMLERLQELLQG